MKWSFLLFSSFLCLQAIAQYPATGNKMRLGWQTTGDGLVYRGAIGDTATLDPSGINNAWMLLDTANGNLYAYRAKAWRLVSGGGGSVSDTLTGEVKGPLDSTYIDTVANIIFRLDSTTVGVGEVKYNDTQGSIQQGLKGGNVTNVIGQQIHQRVLNKTGSPLAKGEAVYLQGSQGNRITVAKAIATIDSTSANTFGIVAESIADNQSGYIITEGLITGLNTNSLTEGAAVYLSPTVAGGLTTTKPQAPDHGVYIGVCVKQNNGSGELFVKIRNGQELEELHDVRITSPDSSASLYYNAAQGIWRDTGAAVLVADTAAMLTNYINVADTATMLSSYISNADTSVFARDFQISGTANRLAMFTGSNTVGNGPISRQSDTLNFVNDAGYAAFRMVNTSGGSSSSTFAGWPNGTRYIGRFGGTYEGFSFGDNSGVPLNSAAMQLTAWAGGGDNYYSTRFRTANNGDFGLFLSPVAANANPTYSATPNLSILQSSGNVGIGTASPGSYLLNLRDSIGFSGNGMYFSSTNGGTANPGGYIIGTKLGSWGTRLDIWLRDSGGSLTERAVSITGGGGGGGSIGINTASPSRPLHVNANTSMIIPSGATGTRPAVGANGDIRYNTDNANFEWYSGTGWREAVNAARSPTAGLANRFSKFDANGLLDTSAVLVQSNGRIGIGVTPTEALQVNGTARATRFILNTFGSQTLSINNYAPSGTLGSNLWIGSGGQSSSGTSGASGSLNAGIGDGALFFNTTGFYNLAFGVNALLRNTTGNLNVSIGGASSSNNLDGSGNTAIGGNSLSSNTSGSFNIAIGYTAMEKKVTGSDNVAIGREAGNLTAASTDNTASDNSIYIGSSTKTASSGRTGEIVIGHAAVGNGSNTTTIGNSSTTATILPAGSLSVSTTSTTNKLNINGNAVIGSSYIGTAAPTNGFLVEGETRIGMTADSGAYALQVNGNTKLIGNLARKKPVTIADTTYTVLSDDSWLICNHTAQIKITLPTAANSIGRELMIKYVAGGGATVISNATNVSPIVGGALTNIILPATAGSWVTLVCDGANWIIMQKG